MEISPLFAVDAEELLENGQVQEAIDLCLAGLEVYPGYPTGEAVLARAYKMTGDADKANEILEEAISKNPFNKALETLKKFDLEIESIEKVERVSRFSNFSTKSIEVRENIVEIEKSDDGDENFETLEDFKFDDEIDILSDIEDFENGSNNDNEELDLDSFMDSEDDLEKELNESEIEVFEDEIEDDFNLDLIEESFNLEEKYLTNINEDYSDLEDFDLVEKFENEEAVLIDYEDISLISGLNKQGKIIDIKPFKKEEILNVNFDYNFSQFPKGHQITIDGKISSLSVESLANSLIKKNASRNRIENIESNISDFNVGEIVTETMGEIYFEQGAYNEAIKVFEKLKTQKPEKVKLYIRKIEEIEEEKEKDLNSKRNFNFKKDN